VSCWDGIFHELSRCRTQPSRWRKQPSLIRAVTSFLFFGDSAPNTSIDACGRFRMAITNHPIRWKKQMTKPRLAGNLRTVAEACGDTKLCRSTVYQLMNSGRLQSIRIPGCRARRIPREAIEQLLRDGLTGGDAEIATQEADEIAKPEADDRKQGHCQGPRPPDGLENLSSKSLRSPEDGS